MSLGLNGYVDKAVVRGVRLIYLNDFFFWKSLATYFEGVFIHFLLWMSAATLSHFGQQKVVY